MPEKRDYYEVLGVSKTATLDEIRKTYRQAALKNHPDHNPGNKEAEERFKEVSEAYQVLSDEEKRSRYDQFGHAGLNGMPDMGGDIFSGFQDLFSQFFGGGGSRSRQASSKGQDIRIAQQISFAESYTGCKKEISFRVPTSCEDCKGSGAKSGTSRVSCSQCGGSGQISTSRGFMVFSQTCPVCRGEGSMVKDPCPSCKGHGAVEKSRKVSVTFPAGIDHGQRLRVPNQGMPPPANQKNGTAGDLFVDVDVESSNDFEREGTDLITKGNVSFVQAALGSSILVNLPDDSSVEVSIPQGTQPHQIISIPGKGFARADGRGRPGSLKVIVDLMVPHKLSSKAKELLKELDKELVGDSKTG